MEIDLTGAEGATYARKSRFDPKNPGGSVGDQEGEVVARLERRGAHVPPELRLGDEGFGASRHSPLKVRKDFEALMHLVRTRPALRVVGFWALSRATRRLRVMGELLDTCEDNDVLLLVGERMYDPASWEDRLQLGITGAVDEAESSRIQENTLRGLRSSQAKGRPHGKNVYGYRRVYDPHSGFLLRVELDPEQATVLRDIAARLLAGESANTIESDLARRGEVRPKGGPWYSSDFKRILLSPVYAGRRVVHGEDVAEGIWPAMFDQQTIDDLRQMFKPRARTTSTAAKYPLAGIVECSKCEKTMYRDSNRGTPAYICKGCGRTRAAAQTEDLAISTAREWVKDPAFRAARSKPKLWTKQAELDALEQEVAENEAMLEAGETTLRLATLAIKPLAERIKALDDEKTRLSEPGLVVLPSVWPTDGAEERALLRGLLRVVCDASKRGRGFDYNSVRILPR